MTPEQILKLADRHARALWHGQDGHPTIAEFTPQGLTEFAQELLTESGSREHWRRTFAAAALTGLVTKVNNAPAAVDAALSAADEMAGRLFPNE